MDRRQFVKVTAASGAGATLAGCGNPENQLIRFIPDERLAPGVAQVRPSLCSLCPAGCGITVRVMEGDVEMVRDGQLGVMKRGLAKKLEGNPDHPINRGRLCVRGQAGIQATYHPDRIREPLRRVGERGAGEFRAVSWDAALEELTAQLDAVAASGDRGALAFLSRPLGGERRRLVSEFLDRFGAPPMVGFDILEERVLRRANELSFGFRQMPTFDLARCRYVLAMGADFLGTWNSPVAQNLGYGEMRQARPGIRGRLVHVEPRMSQTGANADEWIPARPGTEGVLALGMAHEIIAAGLRPAESAGRAGALIQGWSQGLPDYTPAAVSSITGIGADRVSRLAREFVENAPALAMIGGAPLAHTNGLFHALAVNALNALTGNIGQAGGVWFTPGPEGGPQMREEDRSLAELRRDLEADAVSVLLVHEANPVFGSPPAWSMSESLGNVPFIASFGQFIDETSRFADLILPDHTSLESWMDNAPESGSLGPVLGVAAPAMLPLYETRSMPDVLLEIGRRLGRVLEPPLPWETYEQMLEQTFSALPAPEGELNSWSAARVNGGWWPEAPTRGLSGSGSPAREPAGFTDPSFQGSAEDYPYHFLPFASQAFLDGSLAHLPWLQELPDAVSTAMWSSWVELNPQTAADLGIASGDLVEVTSPAASLRAPAVLSPGIAPDVVAMPLGQGHEAFTRYATGVGSNPLSILVATSEPETGSLAWAATRVRVERVAEDGNLILFAGGLEERSQPGR